MVRHWQAVMAPEEIITWLKRKRKQERISASLYAAATLSGGLFVLGLSFSFVFSAAKLVLLSFFPLSHLVTAGSALIASLVTAWIFADTLHAERSDMSGLVSWLFRECIGIGPRLILDGYPYLKRAQRFARMDIERCANVLASLAFRNVPTFQRDLLRLFPDLDWAQLKEELRLLEGVIFFKPDELRVALTLPLRLELRQLLPHRRRVEIPREEPRAVPVNEPQVLSPAEILGVAPAATLAEIKTAYRTRIKECHPDRFATMDDHSKSLAEEWTKSLNAAYDILMTQARRQNQS